MKSGKKVEWFYVVVWMTYNRATSRVIARGDLNYYKDVHRAHVECSKQIKVAPKDLTYTVEARRFS